MELDFTGQGDLGVLKTLGNDGFTMETCSCQCGIDDQNISSDAKNIENSSKEHNGELDLKLLSTTSKRICRRNRKMAVSWAKSNSDSFRTSSRNHGDHAPHRSNSRSQYFSFWHSSQGFSLRYWICLLTCIVTFCGPVQGFNLDMDTVLIQSGEQGSMFGYDVAQHLSTQGEASLLVGAPKASTSQQGVTQGGAVFRCGTSRGIGCAKLEFDDTGNEQKFNGSQLVDIEEKSHQWFGATVVSHRDLIVACAPRFVYHTQNLGKKHLVGNCVASQDLGRTILTEFSPCKRAVDRSNSRYIDQHDQHGKCELGFSASISLGGKRVLLGAPGTWFWQGQVYNFRTDKGSRTSVATPEGKADDDYGFMGYSSDVGEYDGDGIDDYIVGVPRGEALLGKVTLYTQALKVIKMFPGKQLGAFFGTAVVSSDFNNDGLDDIVVGAPQHSDYKSSKSYDKGEVYVYYQLEYNKASIAMAKIIVEEYKLLQSKLARPLTQRPVIAYKKNKSLKDILPKFESFREQILESPILRGRFGATLASLGDINNDQFNDLAVAAPYGGKDKRGVVYIYHGSQNGIKPKISQIIHGKDIEPNIRSFGYSLSGGLDMDENEYPDLLIGAYEADRAILLRSRPIVNVIATQKMNPQLVNLELQTCVLPSTGSRLACVYFETCLQFEGKGVPDTLSFRLHWEIDSIKERSKRAFIEENGKLLNSKKERKRSLQKNQQWCKVFTAFLRNDFRDLLTPIAVEFKYELIQKKDPRGERLIPILDMYSPNPIKTQAQILKNCGEDQICVPDLSLFAETATKTHILGSENTTIEFIVSVENRGEDAFESLLFMHLPHRVFFNRMEAVYEPTSVAVSCTSVKTGNGGLDTDLIVCDLGNPLPSSQKVDLKIQLSPKYVTGTEGNLNFTILVNSTNPENTTHRTDNVVTREIPITAAAFVDLTGFSDPEQATYNASNLSKKTNISHIYLFRNNGPSKVKEAQVQILWPAFHESGLEILPLLEPPVISRGEADCKIGTLSPKNNTEVMYILKRNYKWYKTPYHETDEETEDDKSKPLILRCGAGWCKVITCTITAMPADIRDSVKIQINARVSSPGLSAIGHKGQVIVHSDAMARVISLDYKLELPNIRLATDFYNVTTDVNSLGYVSPPERVPLWIVGVAIAVGLFLLILLILLLWKLGFFKRKRPDSGVPENEPLAENGK